MSKSIDVQKRTVGLLGDNIRVLSLRLKRANYLANRRLEHIRKLNAKIANPDKAKHDSLVYFTTKDY